MKPRSKHVTEIREEIRRQTLTEENKDVVAKIFARGKQISAKVTVPPEITIYAGHGRK